MYKFYKESSVSEMLSRLYMLKVRGHTVTQSTIFFRWVPTKVVVVPCLAKRRMSDISALSGMFLADG
jgi:hypothetical protein